MSRTGKIARLPKGVREELNQRLQNGEPAVGLVEWLNGRRAVKAVLAEHFEGRAVNEQNLSDWKSGGYVEWERNEEAKELMQQLGERAGSIAEANVSVEECLATVLGAEMVSLARVLMDKEEDPQKRWEQLCRVNKELARLRWAKARDSRRSINEERWNWERAELEREETERKREWLKKQQLAPLELLPGRVGLLAQCNGGGELQLWKAARILELRHDLPEGRLQIKDGGWWHWTGTEWKWVVDPTIKVRANDGKSGKRKAESGNGKKKAGKPSKSKRKRSKKRQQPSADELVEQPTSNNQQPTSNGKKEGKEEENGKTGGDDVCQTGEQPARDDGATWNVASDRGAARPTIKEPSLDASGVVVENGEGQPVSSLIKVNQGGF